MDYILDLRTMGTERATLFADQGFCPSISGWGGTLSRAVIAAGSGTPAKTRSTAGQCFQETPRFHRRLSLWFCRLRLSTHIDPIDVHR